MFASKPTERMKKHRTADVAPTWVGAQTNRPTVTAYVDRPLTDERACHSACHSAALTTSKNSSSSSVTLAVSSAADVPCSMCGSAERARMRRTRTHARTRGIDGNAQRRRCGKPELHAQRRTHMRSHAYCSRSCTRARAVRPYYRVGGRRPIVLTMSCTAMDSSATIARSAFTICSGPTQVA